MVKGNAEKRENHECGWKKSIWVYCPFCQSKTKTKIYDDSILLHFPLYCPRCKKEIAVDIIQRKIYSSSNERRPGIP